MSNPVIPSIYHGPFGFPLRWQDDTTGELPAAVLAYLDRKPNARQVDLVRAYLVHHIHAPCWLEKSPVQLAAVIDAEYAETITSLRQLARLIATAEDIGAFIHLAMEIGLDPL